MFHLRDSRAKIVGGTLTTCPSCGKNVQLQLIEVYDSLNAVCVPVGSFLKDYFAVCPECCGVFAVDKAAYIALKGGNKSFIDTEHLKLVSGGKYSEDKAGE